MADSPITISLVDGISAGLLKISGGVNGLGAGFTKLNSAVELFQKGVGFAIDIAEGIGDLITPAREAEAALNRVGVATNATAAELEALRVKSNQVAFDLRVPFDEVAAGAEQLARDGANAAEVLENLETVTAFAGATSLKTKDAAAQLSDILDGYGEGIANIGRIGDGIVAAARKAGVGADELAEGVKKLGPTAREANLDVTTITAALGVLAENGRGGGRAVKELETILIALKDPASKTGEVLKNLGLDSGNLSGVIQRLSTDSAAAEQVLSTLGPKAALSLKLLLTEGGGALTELTGIIKNSGGASKEEAEKLGATFDGAVARIGIALEALKASFFSPLLKPLADGIDVVSAKIQAFAGTKDFQVLQDAVVAFVQKAVLELNRIGSEFDATRAVAGIKQFVSDASDALGSLSTVVSGIKTAFLAIAIAVNAIQVGAATLVATTATAAAAIQRVANATGLAGEEGKRYVEILDGIAESASQSAVENDNQVEAYKRLLNPADSAATVIDKVADAYERSADAAQRNVTATTTLEAVFDAVKTGVEGVTKAVNGSNDLIVNYGNDFVTAVKTPVGPIDTLRARIATLNEDLSKAFSEGADTKQIVKDLNLATAELEKLTGKAKPAGEAVKDLGEEADKSAPKLSALGNSIDAITPAANNAENSIDGMASALGGAADGANDLASSTATATAGLGNLGSSARDAAVDLGQVSAEFSRLIATEGQYDAERSARLQGALSEERKRASERLKRINEESDALDPLKQKYDELRRSFKYIGEDQVKAIAEAEARRDRLKQTNDEVQKAIQRSSGGRPEGEGPIKIEFSNKQTDGMPINIPPDQLATLTNNIINEIARRRLS